MLVSLNLNSVGGSLLSGVPMHETRNLGRGAGSLLEAILSAGPLRETGDGRQAVRTAR